MRGGGDACLSIAPCGQIKMKTSNAVCLAIVAVVFLLCVTYCETEGLKRGYDPTSSKSITK